jgi:DNA-directed RNA polymerase specialized sigma24 family protein
VDRAETPQALPETYRRVLDLLEAGRSDDDIAARLRIEPSAVAPLVFLARAKLARASTDSRPGGDDDAIS